MASTMTPTRSLSLSSSKDEKYDLEQTENGLPGEATLKDIAYVKEAANVELATAIQEGEQFRAWSKGGMIILLCSFLGFLTSCCNGYDGSLMTAINGMTPYKHTITPGSPGLNKTTGIIFTCYTFGQMAGALFFGGPICDRLGRRYGMFIGCIIIMTGAAIISSSNDKGQFIAGRFILGMGIAIAIIGAPTYCVEVAPPHWRGKITGLYNTGWNGGSIPAAAITFGTSYMTSNWAWRIPLILQAAPSAIVAATILFLPESPRWLMAHGRREEAIDFLVKYHGNGDPNHPLVLLQIREFEEAIDKDPPKTGWRSYLADYDWRPLVSTKNARWRFLMVFMMAFFGQYSGNGLGYFNVDIYESLGFNYEQRFAMNLGTTCVSALCAVTGSLLADRMPRRRVLVIGTLFCSFWLAGYVAAGATFQNSNNENLKLGQLGAAFYYLFSGTYAFTYTPLQSLYPAECLENKVRAKGVAAKILIVSTTGFLNLYAGPIALGNIGWRYVCVFVGWDIIESILWYFFAVETVGRSLEELDEVFSADHPVKASIAKHKVAIRKDGRAVEVR